MARPTSPFALTPSDLIALQGWLRMSTLEQSLAQRACILLLLADGLTPKAVSEQLQVTPPTVFKWRKRYLEAGIEGLSDLPRSGQPLKLGPDKITEILTLTTRRVPQEATHWSVRLMAKYARVTTWLVRQVWAASDLKPHRLKTFKISHDPHSADKVVDVVGLYLNPPDNALVLSVDEKTRIHALDRTQPMLPLRPSQVECRTQWLEKHPRFKLHFTPTIASWLNAVEGWFAQLERRALYRGAFTSVADLKAAIRQFIEAHNEHSAKPFKWNKTAESIISSVHKAKPSVIKNKLMD
ncbi:IS630 family transposase [Pseudomonas sp. CLCA07]